MFWFCAPPGESGQTGAEQPPANDALGVAGMRSNVVANGLSLGGDNTSVGTFPLEMRRIVVVVGACVMLSLAFAGAGMPRRFNCPGMGSIGGRSCAAGLGSEVGSVDDEWFVSLLDKEEEEDVAGTSSVGVLRFRPRDVAMALSDEVTLDAVSKH